MRRSKVYALRAQALRDFRAAFKELLAASDEQRFGLGDGMVRWIPRDLDEGSRLRTRANELSGPAGIAVSEAGLRIAIQDAPMFGGRTRTFNPVQAWASAVDGDSDLVPQLVFDTCDQAIGIFERRERDAQTQERSLSGRVARFVRFPLDVREAAGLSDARGLAPKAAFGVGVLVQGVLVAVLGTIVVAALRAVFDFL